MWNSWKIIKGPTSIDLLFHSPHHSLLTCLFNNSQESILKLPGIIVSLGCLWLNSSPKRSKRDTPFLVHRLLNRPSRHYTSLKNDSIIIKHHGSAKKWNIYFHINAAHYYSKWENFRTLTHLIYHNFTSFLKTVQYNLPFVIQSHHCERKYTKL